MSDDIARWLDGLGLGRYVEAFAENDIAFENLPRLTEDDLKELGLSIGHRRTLQAAIDALTAGEPAIAPAATQPVSQDGPRDTQTEAERRQLTVMFCDLVGSTALSTRLDPEDMRDVIRAYQDAVAGVVTRYEGFVAKYMGDGVLVYFGYPAAHEDDAERAINAGLGIVEAVTALEGELAVRIGIATGMVVVGDIVGEGASQEAAITGETPNLASRLQELAEPNSVVIAETTRALAGRMFELDDLGRHDLKGFAETVRVWSVSGGRRAESRFDATRAEHLTELVGRDEEMEILLRRWKRVKSGEGQVVLISGEPGIGKSRLARELQDAIADELHYRLRHQCSPYHINSALYPIIERLERASEFETRDEAETKLERLEALIDLSDGSIEEVAPLFASLLSIQTGDRYPPLNVSPGRQKELTLQALVDQLVGLAARRPVLFIMEDAHWIDPTTMELMELAVERATEAAILVLITFRPEFAAPWMGQARVTPIHLGRLELKDSAAMVDRVTGHRGFPEELRNQIADQTDGVPLFVEELTRSVLETASGSMETSFAIEIPATLQDSLEARLDRLGGAKEIAQIGAVIGRTFDHGLLSHVVALEEHLLRANLEQLVDSGLVTTRGVPPEASYTFKHALVQDTAYNSLLRTRRAELHGRVGRAVAAEFPAIASTEPELLAHHFSEAGFIEPAIQHLLAAARLSMQRSACKEAIEHLKRGLELLPGLPETSDRDRQELSLQITLGPAFLADQGWGSSQAEACYARARDLCRGAGDDRELFPILWGYWMIYGHRRDVGPRRALEKELLEIARTQNDERLLLQAHHAGWGSPYQGAFLSQLEHVEQGLALYDKEKDVPLAAQYGGHDAGVCGLVHKGVILFALGYPDQALDAHQGALSLANQISHAPSTGLALSNFAWFHAFRSEWMEVLRYSNEAIALSETIGAPVWGPTSIVVQGWARVALGHLEEGLAQIREARETLDAGVGSTSKGSLMALNAEALYMAGSINEALAIVEEAFPVMVEGGERLWEANAYTLKGDLLLAHSPPRPFDAEACYQQGLEVARAQSAKSWELRAASRLARLWHSQDNTTEARELLDPIYGWFTEGFDTADLIEARALLEQIR